MAKAKSQQELKVEFLESRVEVMEKLLEFAKHNLGMEVDVFDNEGGYCFSKCVCCGKIYGHKEDCKLDSWQKIVDDILSGK